MYLPLEMVDFHISIAMSSSPKGGPQIAQIIVGSNNHL